MSVGKPPGPASVRLSPPGAARCGSSAHFANGIRRISLTSPIVDHSLPPRRASGRRCSMRGRPSRTASAQTLIAPPGPARACCRRAPAWRAACTRSTPATRRPASRRPARPARAGRRHCSASLWSGGKSVPVALTCSNSASGVRLTVNSPVASTLLQRVLPADRGELHDRRRHAGHRVEGVRRQVVHAVGRAAAHPGDRPRHDDGVEHPVEHRALQLGRVEGHARRGVGHRTIVSHRSRGARHHRSAAPGQRAAAVAEQRAGHQHVEQDDGHGVGQGVGPQPPARARGDGQPVRRPRPRSRPAPRATRAGPPRGGTTQTAVSAAAAAALAAGDPPTACHSDFA